MSITDIALVPPLMARVFFKTFRATRNTARAQAIQGAVERKQELARVSTNWGKSILEELHVSVEHHGTITDKPCVFVGNHISYVDILAVYSLSHMHFVAKADILKWPIVGKAAKAGGTIFVKRDSRGSKLATAEAIRDAVLLDGKQVTVFPEGTTSLMGKPWKKGIFRICYENNIPVQPFSISYNPARLAAYIDKDHFFTHMMKLIARGGAHARIEFGEPVMIKNLDEDADRIEKWSIDILHEQLRKQGLEVPSPSDKT